MSNNNSEDLSSKIEHSLLHDLDKSNGIEDTGNWAQKNNFAHDDVLVGALKRLEAVGVITTSILEKPVTKLTAEGDSILQLGSSEARVWDAAGSGIAKDLLEVRYFLMRIQIT
jgi:hypothetical protein